MYAGSYLCSWCLLNTNTLNTHARSLLWFIIFFEYIPWSVAHSVGALRSNLMMHLHFSLCVCVCVLRLRRLNLWDRLLLAGSAGCEFTFSPVNFGPVWKFCCCFVSFLQRYHVSCVEENRFAKIMRQYFENKNDSGSSNMTQWANKSFRFTASCQNTRGKWVSVSYHYFWERKISLTVIVEM